MRADLLDILVGVGEGVVPGLVQRDAVGAHFSLAQVHALARVDVLDGVELRTGLPVFKGEEHNVLLDVGGVGGRAELGGRDIEFDDLNTVHLVGCLVVGDLLKGGVLESGGGELAGLHLAVPAVLLLAMQHPLPQANCLLSSQNHLKLGLLEVLICKFDLLDVVLVRLARCDFEVPRALRQKAADALVELIGLQHERGLLDALKLKYYELIYFELFLVFVEKGGVQLVLELSVRPEKRRKLLIDLIEFLIVYFEQLDGSAEG